MSKKVLFKIVGKTTDDKLVVSGVFSVFETHGVPLDLIFESLKDNNMIPSWVHFLTEAMATGMSKGAVISRLSEAIFEVYGSEFRDHVIERLNAAQAIVVNALA